MKTKLTLRNRQQQRAVLTRRLVIAGSAILGVATAFVVVLNTANPRTSFAKTSDAASSYNNGVVNAAIQPAAQAKESKSAGSAIPLNHLSLNPKKEGASFGSRNTVASKNIIKSASTNAAFSDAASKNATQTDAAAKMRIFAKAYNAKEKDFLNKVKERNLTLAGSDDNSGENNDVLNNSDPSEGVSRKFVVTYVPEAVTAEVLNFDGKRDGNKVTLKWSTGVEKNNDYFTLERSSDGTSFEEIGKVTGVGNTLDKSDYKFIDKHPLAGKNYYRLKHTDKAGKADYYPENVVEP